MSQVVTFSSAAQPGKVYFHGPDGVLEITQQPWLRGRVKFFDPVRRFGFLVEEANPGDIWFNWLLLQNCGIAEQAMLQDVAVEFQWRPPKHGGLRREAVAIRLIA